MVEAESAVKRESNPATNQQLGQISNWRGFNNPWLPDDDQAVDFSYVNLVENPERYTGYKVSWLQIHCRGRGIPHALASCLLYLMCSRMLQMLGHQLCPIASCGVSLDSWLANNAMIEAACSWIGGRGDVVQGEHPHRVWNQIYSHSCFQGMTNASECTEQRVFYKLISGMRASDHHHVNAVVVQLLCYTYVKSPG